MASFTVNTAKHAVLTPATVDDITLNSPASFVMVTNRTMSGEPIYFRFGDATKPVPDPAVTGNNSYVALTGMTITFPCEGVPITVKVISSAAQAYSVQVV